MGDIRIQISTLWDNDKHFAEHRRTSPNILSSICSAMVCGAIWYMIEKSIFLRILLLVGIDLFISPSIIKLFQFAEESSFSPIVLTSLRLLWKKFPIVLKIAFKWRQNRNNWCCFQTVYLNFGTVYLNFGTVYHNFGTVCLLKSCQLFLF